MKKYVITGSIGHISKPVIEGLVNAGKDVTVITSNAGNVKEIESLNAKALTGSLFDQAFIKKAFEGAEVIYTMVPPIWQTNDWKASQLEIVRNYTEALTGNKTVKYIVNLSSIGAHLGTGTGPIDAVAAFEKELNKLPGVAVKHLRPVFFYYNFLAQVPLLKQAGIMGANYGEQKIALVAPQDIAEAALQELTNLEFSGHSVRYVVSDERTGNEVAEVLGNAIGKKFPWVVFTDEQQLKGLQDGGLPATHAHGFTKMGNAQASGKLLEDYQKNKPAFSKTKLEDFAKEFAAVFNA
jgi:uncharacterized protein YbjT (DUF2867 family)